MPIRLNLLAEAQAAEELRRRDPVKRVMWIAGLLVVLMLVWSISIQLKAMIARSELNQTEARVAGRTNEYQSVLESQKKATETDQKLRALHRLATNRFLNGTLLDALQKTTIEGIQLTHLRVEQSYAITEEIKARTNSDRFIPGKPGGATEKIVITLEAKDFSSNPGDLVSKYSKKVSSYPFFEKSLGKTNEFRLTKLVPQSVPGELPFVSFALECRFPDKTR